MHVGRDDAGEKLLDLARPCRAGRCRSSIFCGKLRDDVVEHVRGTVPSAAADSATDLDLVFLEMLENRVANGLPIARSSAAALSRPVSTRLA